MLYTIFYTLIGIPTGYATSIFINDAYKMFYNRNISSTFTYSIIIFVTFFAFLKGYTGNDLVTNINEQFL
jgi:hypothetical protein